MLNETFSVIFKHRATLWTEISFFSVLRFVERKIILPVAYLFVRNATNFAVTVPLSILAFYLALHIYLTIIPRYFGPFL